LTNSTILSPLGEILKILSRPVCMTVRLYVCIYCSQSERVISGILTCGSLKYYLSSEWELSVTVERGLLTTDRVTQLRVTGPISKSFENRHVLVY
jgi:hypothetical protein